MWTCEDMTEITLYIFDNADTNGDGSINLGDEIDAEHLDILVEYCDTNNDGTLTKCEIFDCVVMCENEWRDEYCPEYGYATCE